ncbi:MAG: pyridoxamine 5'-phosphate oxidase family protein, partial [Promethearchaeota archaeon]
MRRKDKEITDTHEIETILKRAVVCRIAFSENNKPYMVPVNFGYTD